MRKTPSYLKGLAETRARAAGDLKRHTQLKAELDVLLPELEADLNRYRKMHERVCRNLDSAKSDLASCDRLIRKFDGRLDPEEIEPICAHKGKYGGWGRLRQSIQALLKECSPESVTTLQIAMTLEIELELDFATPAERRAWVHNSIGNSLKKMVGEGVVERLHDPSVPTSQVGRWRWASARGSELEALQQAAAKTGIGTSQAKRRGRPPAKAKPNS